jgi:hypothetical protein
MSQVCKRCEKIDSTVNQSGYCSSCLMIVKKEYEIVRQYVRLHPKVTVIEVQKATGVSFKAINRMVKEGDLSLADEQE